MSNVLMIKEKLVSSANIIGSNRRDAFDRLLAYIRNRNGPRTDPLETPKVRYLRFVLLFSPIWMYCFLLDK